MSVLSESSVNHVAAAVNGGAAEDISIPPEVEQAVRLGINRLFWKWYEDHKDATVSHVHFWFFTREIKVSDLRELFLYLFGAEDNPGDVVTPAAQ